MKLNLMSIVAVLFLTFGWMTVARTSLAGGQDAGARKGADETKKETPKKDLKDPTEPSPKLKEILNQPKMGKGISGPRYPSISLHRRVISKDRPAAALLEVDGRIVIVTKGNSVTTPNGITLTITELDVHEVRIEVLPYKESIILR